MITMAQLLIKYALLEPLGVNTSLNSFEFSMLILASICIAAAGYIINDIYDVETDTINKPDKVVINTAITEKLGFNLFVLLNCIGVAIGFFVSYQIDNNALFSLFVIISALLYVYASYLKRLLLIGNIVIALLVATSILIVGIFELLPGITVHNQNVQLAVFKIIFFYAFFAFIITLIREIVKDMEDVSGDSLTGMHTLPILFGLKRTAYIATGLTWFTVIGLLHYLETKLYKNMYASGYFLLFIIGPLIYVSIQLLGPKSNQMFSHVSQVLKLILAFGMLSLLLYKFILLK